jgi:antitoxin PrlF
LWVKLDGGKEEQVRRKVEQKARVTSKGQITIPKGVRMALGVKEGDSLVFEVEDGGARVSVIREPVSFADYEGAWREGEGMTWDEINVENREFRGHDDPNG